MNKTSIEWVKNPDGSQGYTWNPITGCLNGCSYCYARRLANGRLKQRYLANDILAPINEQYLIGFNTEYKPEEDPFYPRFWEERLIDPDLESKKPKGIFPVDMGELFAPWIPTSWTRQVIEVMAAHPQHRFYPLTHQPQELPKWSPFPDHCYVGVTATNPQMTKDACYWLREIEAKVKFISFEPLLDDVAHVFFPEYIDWLIIGAQTKPYKPPKIEWVEEIVRAADKAGVKVFLKDNLKPLILQHAEDKDAYWADLLLDTGGSLRQEMPVVTRV